MNLVEILKSAPLPTELAFARSEYEKRVQVVQEKMGYEGLDFLIISSTPSLGYLTGYDSTMPCGYTIGILQTNGGVDLHASELEAPCALLSSTIENVAVFYWTDAQDTATQLANMLSERGADGKRIGLEMGNLETFATGALDVRSYLRLCEHLPNAEFIDATALVLGVRLIKTEVELSFMREAGRYTALGLQASIEAATEGRTDNEVVAAGYHAMVAAGSELMSIDPMIMSGPRTAYMPHIPYRRVTLRRGDPIYLEYSGCYNRYNAPAMRSAVIGKPTDGIRRLADAAIETVEILLEAIAPGRTANDVAREAKRGFDSAPNGTYFHGGYGYSIGMGFQPSWTENPVYIAEGVEDELRPGMTFHLPICTWVPSEKFGVGFSESVVVTESGCETLTPGTNRNLAVR